MKLKESGEMYLESIYILGRSKDKVRSIDLAEHMNYSKPSVSRAVGILKSEGYIEVNSAGHISLTDKGLAVANSMVERHTTLSNMLISIGVDEKTAVEDACRIEHVISEQTFTRIREHLDKMKMGK